MNLRLITSDTSQAHQLSLHLSSHQEAIWSDNQGTEHRRQVTWTGPSVRTGLWQSTIEWLATIDISRLPADIAIGIISNYLWSILEPWMHSRTSPRDDARPLCHDAQFQAHGNQQSTTIFLSTCDKQIEIDPNQVDYGTIQVIVGSFFSDQYPSKIDDH